MSELIGWKINDESLPIKDTGARASIATIEGEIADINTELNNLKNALPTDLDINPEDFLLYLINSRGGLIGNGVEIETSLDGLTMETVDGVDDDGNDAQYLVLYDKDRNEVCRTTFNVNVTSTAAGDTVKLINNVSSAMTIAAGDPVTLSYTVRVLDSSSDIVADTVSIRYTIDNKVYGYTTVASGGTGILELTSGEGGILAPGDHTIVVKATDSQGNSRSITYSVTVINLTVSSTFDNSSPFIAANMSTNGVVFPFKPQGGTINKIIHLELDGTEVETLSTFRYNTEMSYTFTNLTHGHHVIRCWLTATLNGGDIDSNILRYDFLYVRAAGSSIIMAADLEEGTADLSSSPFVITPGTTLTQGEILNISYLLYNPSSERCNLRYGIEYKGENEITGNETWFSYYTSPTLTVDQTQHTLTIRDYPSGTIRIRFYATAEEETSWFGAAIRTFYLEVEAGDLQLAISQTNLALFMSAESRSNDETASSVNEWRDRVNNNVAATLTGFDWKTNGWIQDRSGNVALKVSGGATVNIPFYPFLISPIATGAYGMTIELEFMTDEVSDPDAVLLSCVSPETGIGFKVTAEEITFSTSAQTLRTPFEPGKRMHVAIVVDSPSASSGDKLIHMYINGVDGSSDGVKTFSGGGDIITQGYPITAASDGAAIWIYAIRVYSAGMTRNDLVNNYIAAIPSVSEQAAEYIRNQIFDANSNEITYAMLQENVPDLTIVLLTGAAMPTAKISDITGAVTKTDATVSGQIIDANPSLCVSFTNQKIAVQGTSSATYYRKNYKLTIKSCWLTSDDTITYDGYTLREDSMRAQKFTFKADVASSEQANNVLLARLYNDHCPYLSPAQNVDNQVRQGIDGKPCVIFFTCTDPNNADYHGGQPQFYGKYNFNIDKGSENVFGFVQEDNEGNARWPNAQSWEFCDNTSPRCRFEISDFVTVTNGEYEWLNDFEARYPENSTNTTLFAALCAWIASTNSALASGEELNSRYYVDEEHLMGGAVEYDYTNHEHGARTITTVTDGNGYERKVVSSTNYVTETITVDGDDYTVMPIDSNGDEQYYYDRDTAAYRREVFYQELSQHFDINDIAFYYVFTELFLMVDNRAKNMFLTTYDGDIWMFLPYDFDTALGINNTGGRVFSYGLEATDTINGDYVYNDEMGSVLWKNFMDTFSREIAAMYQNMETSGAFTLDNLLRYFSNHQNNWPIALWNEDQNWKYAPSEVGSETYLGMWQGKKESQREWWLRRRITYISSKYLSQTARDDVITFRVYSPEGTTTALAASIAAVPPNPNIRVTPYQDVYVNAKWGSWPAKTRAYADTEVLMTAPAGVGSANDTETYIYSASAIKDLGDLSALYVGYIDVTNAIHLESLRIGNADTDYINLKCSSVSVGNNTALKTIDVRGCAALVGTLNLSNCPNIETIYAERTSLAAVTTPDGGCIKTIHLPGTLTSLFLRNQTSIEDFSCAGYSNIQALWIENCPYLDDDLKDILAACTSLTHVRLINVDWDEDSADTLVALAALGGLDENGNTTAKAVVTGKVNITNCSADDLSTIHTAFPNLTVTYTNAAARLTFVNDVNSDGEGGETLFTLDVPYGGTGYYPYDGAAHSDIAKPELASTARYSYEFTGWSGSVAIVTESRTITAQYASTVRTYGVTWKNGSTVLGYGTDGTDVSNGEDVAYGTTLEWTGNVPAYTGAESDMVFAGWTFTNTDDNGTDTVTASESLTGTAGGTTIAAATFVQLAVPATATGFSSCTLGQIIALCKAAYDGTLQSKTGYADLQAYGWQVGDEKTITLKSGESVVFIIWGFGIHLDENGDTLPVTIGQKYCLTEPGTMNSDARTLFGYTINGGAENKREVSDYVAYEQNGTVLPGSTTYTHTVSAAGNVEITFTKRTYLTNIIVTEGANTFTFDLTGARDTDNLARRKEDNYLAQEDIPDFTARTGKVELTTSINFSYTGANNVASPTITVDGTNGAVKIFDRNLSSNDQAARAIEFMPGSKITIPMSTAGSVKIAARGLWAGGGFYASRLRRWMQTQYVDQLPAIIQQRLIPVRRITQIGALDWDTYDTYYDKILIPTYRELGFGSATTQPYCNENNTALPAFPSNDARKLLTWPRNNQNAATRVWSSSTTGGSINHFSCITVDGTNSSNISNSTYGIVAGFCVK